jgi:NitT/TauT family transport system substrate-binding protein
MKIGRRHLLQSVAGLGLAATASGRARAQSGDAVSLRLNAIAYGEHAAFALGVQNGHYAAERINLKLVQGNGSGATVQIAASKQDMFGYADAGTVMRAVSRGVPVRMCAVFQQVSPLSIISFTEKGLRQPKDLEGRSIALTAGDALHQLLPAMLRKNNVDPSKVRLLFMDIASKSTAVVDGKADAMGGYFTTQAGQIAAVAGKPTSWIKYSDFGVNTIAGGIVVNNDILKEQSDLVRRFLRASARAWSEAEQNPEAAADALVKQFPDSSFIKQPGQALAQWQAHRALTRTPRSQGKPPGWVADADVQDTVDLLAEFAELSPKGKVSDYVTNDFLPA